MSRFLIVFIDILLPLLLGKALKRWGLDKRILRGLIKLNVVGVMTFLSIVSFWSVKASTQLLWLPFSIIPICFLPAAIFYLFQRHRFSDPREQGSYLVCMVLGNIGTLAGLCAYVLFGAKGFAYIQLIAVPQILIIVLFCFPMSQYYHDKWAGTVSGKQGGSILRSLFTPNQLPAVGVVIGLLLSHFQVPEPEIVGDAFSALIHISAWMGMVPVGYDLNVSAAKKYAMKLWPIFPIKFILLPVVMYALSSLIVTDQVILACVILASAAPTAIFSVAAAQLYELNVDLAESSFLTTTIAFLFILYPVLYMVMRNWA